MQILHSSRQPAWSPNVSARLLDAANALVGQIQPLPATSTLHLLCLREGNRVSINWFTNISRETQVRAKKRDATNEAMLSRQAPSLRPWGLPVITRVSLCLKTESSASRLSTASFALRPSGNSSEHGWTNASCI